MGLQKSQTCFSDVTVTTVLFHCMCTLKKNKETDKGLISKIYKQLLKLNSRKINDPIKNGPKIQTDISPKKT